jgi:hypothetical protein
MPLLLLNSAHATLWPGQQTDTVHVSDALQDTLDSVEGEKDVDARDEDGENQGGHWR